MEQMTLFGGESIMESFKKKIYYEIKEAVSKNVFVILTGPRQTGKTVCFEQLTAHFGGEYFDFKELAGESQEDTSLKVCKALKENQEKVFLLDEITHLDEYDTFLCSLAQIYAGVIAKGFEVKTRIIITGSQSLAINYFARKALGTRCAYVKADFMNFEEYLLQSKRINRYGENYAVTEDDYLNYVKTAYSFSKLNDVKSYLRACLDETVISNKKSDQYFVENASEGIRIDICLRILYTTLLQLHDTITFDKFQHPTELFKKIKGAYNQVNPDSKITSADFEVGIAQNVANTYLYLQRIDYDLFLRNVRFLIDCGLLIINVLSDSSRVEIELEQRLNGRTDVGPHNYTEFFNVCSLMIKYPAFYYCILNDLAKSLGRETETLLTRSILGSLVECNVKGILSEKHQQYLVQEYRQNVNGVIHEVDYFYPPFIAVEISIRDKGLRETHLLEVPASNKYLLGKQREEDVIVNEEVIHCIPYYKFILMTTQEKDR